MIILNYRPYLLVFIFFKDKLGLPKQQPPHVAEGFDPGPSA